MLLGGSTGRPDGLVESRTVGLELVVTVGEPLSAPDGDEHAPPMELNLEQH
jgi:hypothetical protein